MDVTATQPELAISATDNSRVAEFDRDGSSDGNLGDEDQSVEGDEEQCPPPREPQQTEQESLLAQTEKLAELAPTAPEQESLLSLPELRTEPTAPAGILPPAIQPSTQIGDNQIPNPGNHAQHHSNQFKFSAGNNGTEKLNNLPNFGLI